MLYRYKAFGTGGQVLAGEIDAPGRAMAMTKLRTQGLLVDTLRPAPSLKINWNMELGAPKMSLRKQSIFFNQLAMLISGGVPVLQSLQVLAGNSRGPIKVVLERMIREVDAGQSLSRAMAAQRTVFPRLAIHIISVSELAGELDSGLRLLAQQFDAEDQLQRKFKTAMVYPSVVLFMALALVVFMLTFIVPTYADMFASMDAELPWETQTLLSLSGFIINQWYIVLALALLVGFGHIYEMAHSDKYRLFMHRLLLRIPIFGPLTWHRETARYTRTLGTMLKSGVPVLAAAQAAADLLQNDALATRFAAVPGAISNGSPLGRAIRDSGGMPPIMAELLTVGEAVGNSDTTLQHITTFMDADVKQTVDRLTSILEPVMILILGGIVVSVIVPTMLPMYDLYTKIK